MPSCFRVGLIAEWTKKTHTHIELASYRLHHTKAMIGSISYGNSCMAHWLAFTLLTHYYGHTKNQSNHGTVCRTWLICGRGRWGIPIILARDVRVPLCIPCFVLVWHHCRPCDTWVLVMVCTALVSIHLRLCSALGVWVDLAHLGKGKWRRVAWLSTSLVTYVWSSTSFSLWVSIFWVYLCAIVYC